MIRLRRPMARPVSPRRGDPVWLLDLDNTLHDAMPVALPRINQAITDFVRRKLAVSEHEAGELRAHYWRRYGATLLGLVRHHGIDPHEYLRETHRFPDMARVVRKSGRLRRALAQLSGRRVIVTNAPHHYARSVVRALGVGALIEGIVSIETMRYAGGFQPKPSRAMMRRIVARLRAHPARCVLVEDTIENLAGARAAGVRTVLVPGMNEARRPLDQRSRAGSARHAELQVQSVGNLARRMSRRLSPQA